MFRVFSTVFLCFSRVFTGIQRGKKSLVFWVVFLGFYLNTKEWKIRGAESDGIGRNPAGGRQHPHEVACSPVSGLKVAAGGPRRASPLSFGDDRNHSQKAADVWEKDVWEFQAKSGSSGFCCFFPLFPRENRNSRNVWESAWKSQTSFFQTSAAF